jgi:hypothetical protein
MHHFHSEFRECIIVSSKDLVEIVFHGRGGQGAVTAANLLVAAAIKVFKRFQSLVQNDVVHL